MPEMTSRIVSWRSDTTVGSLNEVLSRRGG
jgi:hypothetical protein